MSPGKRVFGVSLSANVRQTGQPLPPTILHAIDFLNQENNLETTGVFRRAASKAKVDSLKELMESNPGIGCFGRKGGGGGKKGEVVEGEGKRGEWLGKGSG